MRFKALSAAVVFGAGPAGAHTVSDESTISIFDIFDSAEAFGAVGSPNPKCIANRTVAIYGVRASGPRLFDVDKTSREGFWSGGGENLTQAASAVRVKVLAKNIGPKGDAHVCKAAATSRPLA